MVQEIKVRVKYIKGTDLRWLSHLDVARAIERGVRRAQIPVAYSQGFSPHPKIAYGRALPVGVSSQAEYFDVALREPVMIDKFIERLNESLPSNLKVLGADLLKNKSSLIELAERMRYNITLFADCLDKEQIAELTSRRFFLALKKIKIKSDIKQADLSDIDDFQVRKCNGKILIDTTVGKDVRPHNLIAGVEQMLDIKFKKVIIERTAQYAVDADGNWRDLINPAILGE